MAKIKILLIEDDSSLINIFKSAVNNEKYDLILAADSEEGVQRAILEKPQIILLDILLPGKNGFECLRELKLHNKTKNIPVIILSNIGQEEEVKKSIALGAIDYLIKSDMTIQQIFDAVDSNFKKV